MKRLELPPDPGPVPPALPAHRHHSPRHVADAGKQRSRKARYMSYLFFLLYRGGWLAEKIRKFVNLKSSLDLRTFSKCGTFADFRFAVPIFLCDLPIRDLADPFFFAGLTSAYTFVKCWAYNAVFKIYA